MKAKLVYLSLVTRVVVEDDADWDAIVEVARPKFAEKIQFEYLENIEEIQDDLECPHEDKATDCGIDKLVEIRMLKFRGILYEVHVDATEARCIFEVFPESGKVTEEIREALDEAVDKIDH